MDKLIINRFDEGHFSLKENPDGTIVIEKNLQYRFTLADEGIVRMENALTGRVFSMKNE